MERLREQIAHLASYYLAPSAVERIIERANDMGEVSEKVTHLGQQFGMTTGESSVSRAWRPLPRCLYAAFDKIGADWQADLDNIAKKVWATAGCSQSAIDEAGAATVAMLHDKALQKAGGGGFDPGGGGRSGSSVCSSGPSAGSTAV